MILYRIAVADPHAHLFEVTLRIPAPAAEQRLSLPVWIPGSYLVREFARHLSGLAARQGRRGIALTQLDKATWLAHCSGAAALVVTYRVYAFDTSVRAAFLDAGRGFINGSSLALRVEGREAEPHQVELHRLPQGWQVATALEPADDAALTYVAADYDALADSPIELGRFWRGGFSACGVPHEFVVSGAWPDFDAERLLADARRICEAQIGFWHGADDATRKPPFARYLFMLNAIEDGHGGLEHRASTALLAARRDLPQRGKPEAGDGYANLLGLISHEYFHAWNVKRLRPAELARYDYTRENYTRLLWFFEGFTSYYDDLFLVRSGLVDAGRYLNSVARSVSAMLASPGRKLQSLAESSFDAWVKYYRSDENTPNATISYYTKGSLVALALDLSLRLEGPGCLDDVMRELWAASSARQGSGEGGREGGPISEADIAAALQKVGGRSFAPELAAWVHGTDDLPLPALLGAFGITWQHHPATAAQRLGLRVSESALTGIKASHVLRGGAAERAGIAAGDELIALQGWRLRRLDDALRLLVPGEAAPLLVFRDQRVLALHLTLPADAATAGAVALQCLAQPPAPALARREAWLAG
jgi:predicted metalloprotease with PDZ domain